MGGEWRRYSEVNSGYYGPSDDSSEKSRLLWTPVDHGQLKLEGGTTDKRGLLYLEIQMEESEISYCVA